MSPAVPAALALLVVFTGACSSTEATPLPEPTSSPAAPDTGGTPLPREPATAPIVASWAPDAPATELPDGWTMRDCPGDAPIICVDRDGAIAGRLVLDSFPLDTALAAAEDDEATAAALRANAESRIDGLKADRAAGCGYEVTGDSIADVLMGGLPGVRAGIRSRSADGTAELVMTYATVSSGQLWILVAESAAEGTCMDDAEMDLFTPSALDAFLPVLDRVVAGTPLPAAGTRVEDGTVLGVDGGLDGGKVLVFVGGELHRVQQPRAMDLSEMEAAGIAIGDPVVHVELAPAVTGSWFAIAPPDGPTARLYLITQDVAHPVVIQSLANEALAGIPPAATPALDQLTAR